MPSKKGFFVKKGLAGSQQIHASMLNNVDMKANILKDYHMNILDQQDREQRVLSKVEKKRVYQGVRSAHKAFKNLD